MNKPRSKIDFCSHANDKFDILKQHGFPINRSLVIQVLKDPDKIEQGFGSRFIAQKTIDEKHVLRVVFEKKGKTTLVVTFYPGRRSYYES